MRKQWHWTEIRASIDQASHAAASTVTRSWFNDTGSNTGSNHPLFSLTQHAVSALPLATGTMLAVPACAFLGLHPG